MIFRKLGLLVLALALVLLIAACAGRPTVPPPVAAPPTSVPQQQAPTSGATGAALTEVNVVMGYIPDIQFAPYFVADQKGYFAQEGLKIKYSWGFEIDGIKLLGANQADFAMLGGDQIIQARSQGIPIVYVANYYNAFPIAIFSLKDKNITKPQDLVGKRVGLPALFGATYTGWRALLYSAGIKESDVQVQDVGFTQIAAVTQGVVDAAAGYSNNEPVQLKLAGKDINVIQVGDYSNLVGMGLATNEKTLADKPQIVQKMVRALMHGIQDTIANPNEAVQLSLKNLPEAGGANLTKSQTVLNATVALWKNTRVGYVDPVAWTFSAKFMKDAGFIKTHVDVNKAYTNQFVP